MPENKLQSPSEDQEVEEDPLEDKIHRILGDLEEEFLKFWKVFHPNLEVQF